VGELSKGGVDPAAGEFEAVGVNEGGFFEVAELIT